MAYISQVKYEDSSDAVKAQIDDQIKKNGRITNMKLTLLHSLPAFHALMEWYTLKDNLEEFLSERAINFFCYAISTENDCLVCGTFFAKILKDLNIDFNNFAFTDEEQVLIDFGRAIVKDANNVPPEIFERLKTFWNEEQIVLITSFATIMIATNLVNKILQVNLDDYLLPYTRQ